MSWSRVAVLAALVAAVATPASAQTDPAPAGAPFTAGWQDGFVIQQANGDNRLVFGMVAQTDGRFSVNDPLPLQTEP